MTSSVSHVRSIGAVLAAFPLLSFALFAAPAGAAAAEPEPGVARLAVASGGVSVKRSDSEAAVAASANAPLNAGDYVTTADDGRAEIQFDYGTVVRVGAATQLRFTQLDRNLHQLQVAAGTVDLRVFRGLDAHPEIQTPQATLRPEGAGSFRVRVDDDGTSEITPLIGPVDVVTAAGTQTISPGSSLVVRGEGNAPSFETVQRIADESFDRWNAERDRSFSALPSYAYIDEDLVGAQDLYDNGRWVDEPQYGQVWVPAVAADWAPYHHGRWVWEPYYGWTWVGSEPWGWAPYHYGNWFYLAGTGWAWYPGEYAVARPFVYRPALVAFFSFGGGGGLSAGFGNVGWVPIAPFEPYRPWYGSRTYVNATYVNDTTVVNNDSITKTYRNALAPGGAVAVDNGRFARGNFGHPVAVAPSELENVTAVREGVVPVVPTARNLAFRGGAASEPVRAPLARFAAFKTQPRAVPAFEDVRSRVETSTMHAYPPAARSARPQTSPIEPHPAEGWNRFETRPASAGAPAYAHAQPNAYGGLRTDGDRTPEAHSARTHQTLSDRPSHLNAARVEHEKAHPRHDEHARKE